MSSYANYMLADALPEHRQENRYQPYGNNANNYDMADVNRYSTRDYSDDRNDSRAVRENVETASYIFDNNPANSRQLMGLHQRLAASSAESPWGKDEEWMPWMQSSGLPVTQARITDIDADTRDPYGHRMGDRTREDDYIIGANAHHLHKSDRLDYDSQPEQYTN